MNRAKPLLLFFLRLVLLYGLLIYPWPGTRQAYAACFRVGATLLFSSFGSNGQVTFEPYDASKLPNDVQMTLRNRAIPSASGSAELDSRMKGYYPTAFFVALMLATPIPWARRWKKLLMGIVLVNAFVAFRLYLFLYDAFTGNHFGALFQPSEFWESVHRELTIDLVQAPSSHFIVPLFIWIIVAVRRKDLERWLPNAQP